MKRLRAINVRSSKIQTPSASEAQIVKLQGQEPTLGSVAWWEQKPLSAPTPLIDKSLEKPRERDPFDLEKRKAIFGEEIVKLSKKIPRNPANKRLIDQLVGTGTSIGGNYGETNDAIKRCLKESKATRFFLCMVAASEPVLAIEARDLYRKAGELVGILDSMCRK